MQLIARSRPVALRQLGLPNHEIVDAWKELLDVYQRQLETLSRLPTLRHPTHASRHAFLRYMTSLRSCLWTIGESLLLILAVPYRW